MTSNSPEASLYTRLQLDFQTLNVMMPRPLVGVGLDAASQRQFVVSPPEDMFLLSWLGGGIFGLLGLVLILGACTREGLRKVAVDKGNIAQALTKGVFVSFLSTLVFALASPVLQQRYAWVAAAVLLAMRPDSVEV